MGASPADRADLAPLDVREHSGWLRYIKNIFSVKHTDTVAEARGVAPTASLTVGRQVRDTRGGASVAKMGNRSRGNMADIPTPQTLIRQVTGIGDPPRGR